MTNDVAAMINEQAQAANDQWGQSEMSSGCCGGSAPASQGCGCHGPSSVSSSSDVWELRLAGVIDGLRPLFQARGGDIELVAIEDRNAVVRFSGKSFGNEAALEQVCNYVKMELTNNVPGFGELVTI